MRLLRDHKERVGSLARVNADDVERLIVEVLARELSRPDRPAKWLRSLVRDTVERIVIERGQLQMEERGRIGFVLARNGVPQSRGCGIQN